MSALSFVFRLILFYTFVSLSDGTVQWYDAVNLCKQKGQILHPEITSNESSFGYRQDTTMWTSSYILSVDYVKHTALFVEQIPVTEVHRGLCIDKKDKPIVFNIPYNYPTQDFKCSWDYQRLHPDSLLNITSLSVVREVLNVMDFGQKYWLSNISESVFKLVHQCEVFQYVANSTSVKKSYIAMRYCDEMNSYKCFDGKNYRPAVSLVKYLHDRHGNFNERKRTNNPGLDKGTVSKVVKDTTAALCKRQNDFIKWPRSDAEKNKIKAGNYRIGGFPNVIGAIDGTHIRIQAPTTDEASYVNRKGYHSINVQALCDRGGKFTNINTSWPGNAHDVHIFRTSQIRIKPERACSIIMSCAILHNIALWMNEPKLPEDQEEEMPNVDAVYNGANDGRKIRDHITQMNFTN